MLAIVWRMIDPKMIDEFSEHLAASLPGGIRTLQADLLKNFKASVEAALAKLDLVTREEFDVQRAVLARTRDKLARLEAQVKALEAELEKPSG